jgi:hypothetical protein
LEPAVFSAQAADRMECDMNHITTISRDAADSARDREIGEDRQAATFVTAAPAGHPDADFVEALLAALTAMAVRSPRRQADLGVALRRSGIEASAAELRQAIAGLEADGCIEHVVPLTDGGLLMQVTAHGIERLSQTNRRHVLDFLK